MDKKLTGEGVDSRRHPFRLKTTVASSVQASYGGGARSPTWDRGVAIASASLVVLVRASPNVPVFRPGYLGRMLSATLLEIATAGSFTLRETVSRTSTLSMTETEKGVRPLLPISNAMSEI